ncbi:MAG TPA: hypothetical protein VGQ28_00275 [Thermoanaerobaculia bacterium]|nr:hypothetical protein [Thermoanaerobaculia bacterium]
MSDRLLRELGDLARSETKAEEARFDERWDRLAAGTLTAKEEAELKALAESSPEYQEAFDAFRPLGAEFQARVVSAIQFKQAERDAEERQRESQKPPPPVLPFRRVIRRTEVWVGLAAAVAAGVFFMVWTPAMQPLPEYAASLSGGVQASRGGEPGLASELQVFVPGSPLSITVTPQTSVQSVEARVFLSSLSRTGDFLPWEPEPVLEITDQGAVRLQGTLGKDIQLPPGGWRIWIVVGRKGRLPSGKELQAQLRRGRGRHADWQAISSELRVKSRASP